MEASGQTRLARHRPAGKLALLGRMDSPELLEHISQSYLHRVEVDTFIAILMELCDSQLHGTWLVNALIKT